MNIPTIALDQLPAGAVLLDVREDDEWQAGHIAEAVHVPMNDVPSRVAAGGLLPLEQQVVVVCKVGGRSAQVTAWLVHNGFDAVNLEGGMLAWQHARRPMISETGAQPEVI